MDCCGTLVNIADVEARIRGTKIGFIKGVHLESQISCRPNIRYLEPLMTGAFL